ncbi:MAG: hypothetical protein AB2A00_41025 [Myxococcota bacterium]
MTTAVAGHSTARTYRPYLALRLALVVAFCGWTFAAMAAVTLPELGGWQRVMALGFCVMFTILGGHYLPLEIQVDDQALTYRGFFKYHRIRFDEILAVDVLPVPLSVFYGIRTEHMVIAFTNFISGHRDLAEHILRRARLARR